MTTTAKARPFHHTVVAIHFEPGTEDGPCSCECGWSGQASEHPTHRKANGAPKMHRWRATEDTPEWNRTLNPEAQGKRREEAAA